MTNASVTSIKRQRQQLKVMSLCLTVYDPIYILYVSYTNLCVIVMKERK